MVYRLPKNSIIEFEGCKGFEKLSIGVEVNNGGKVKLRGKYCIILPSMLHVVII
jgi:hypothetical protein